MGVKFMSPTLAFAAPLLAMFALDAAEISPVSEKVIPAIRDRQD